MQVFQLVYRQIKELAKASLIFVVPLFQREHHVACEDNGRVSGQGVIGDGSRLFAQLQIGLAHLEEDLDVPTLAISLDNLFFRQRQVRRDQDKVVAALVLVADVDQPHGEMLAVLGGLSLYGEQVSRAPVALPLASVDGLDVLHAALEAEVHLLAFLDTRDDVVAELVDLVQRCR